VDYDWRGFLFLFLSILIFILIVLLIAGGVKLVQRSLRGRKTRNQIKERERAEIARKLREDSP